MKILVVSQYYYPEQFRVNDICEELVRKGHYVTVLTGLPNYPKGELYEGYENRKRRREKINGVEIVRCNLKPRKTGFLHLALNYLSFVFGGNVELRKIKGTFDAIFVYQMSPVTMAIPAIHAKKKFGSPLVLYCLDLWPASILDMNIKRDGIFYNIVKKISRSIYRKCDQIIVSSPSFKKYLHEVCGVLCEKMTFIPQHAEDIYEENLKAIDNGIVDFMFLGNIGLSQNCECIVKAADLLDKKLSYKVHFVGAGSNLDNIKKLVFERKLDDKIVFHGFQKMEKLPEFYRLADVCVLTLANETEIGLTIPAKLQGYMAAGKAVVASISGDAAQVINEAECGYQVEAGDVKGLAEIMAKYIERPYLTYEHGINGKKYFSTHFSKNVVISQLEKVLEDV